MAAGAFSGIGLSPFTSSYRLYVVEAFNRGYRLYVVESLTRGYRL